MVKLVVNLYAYTIIDVIIVLQYNVEQLKSLCKQSLYPNLSADNVADYLVYADNHSEQKLKARALMYITA